MTRLQEAGLENLVLRVPSDQRYTFNYRGQSQVLDHLLVTPVLARGAVARVVHVNADRPHAERASDHDPVWARLQWPAMGEKSMRRRGFPGAVATVTTLLLGGACASAPPHLPTVREQLVAYVESGRYGRDVARAVAPARRFLESRGPQVDRPALVLDIDETSLSTWSYQRERGFCYTPTTFESWSRSSTPPPLEPTLSLYRRARELGVTVFFVTGRREDERSVTERALREAGYGEWERLYLRPEDDTNGSVVPYKSGARREIEAEGYTIVLNLGDQRSDLEGGHALRPVLLPNPFYGLP